MNRPFLIKGKAESALGTLKSVLVVWTLLTALTLASCDVSGGVADGQQVKTPEAQGGGTAYDGSDYGETAYGELAVGADGKASLTVTIQDAASEAASGAAKSVAGLGEDDIKTAAAAGIINYHELVMVNNADISKIVEFDSITGSSPVHLSAGVVIGNTYHIMILSGNKDGNNAPTLLASSYAKETLSVGNTRITFTMTPAIVDAAFVEDSDTQEVRQLGRLAKTVGLDAGKAYSLRYIIGDGNEGVVAKVSDSLKKANGNGLSPLVNAEGGTVSGMDYWGRLTLRSNRAFFKPTSGTQVELLDHYSASTGSGNDTTTGEAEYYITSVGNTGTTGKAWFNMEYVPFGKLDDAAWANSTDFHTQPGGAPVWIIRNGLNDTAGAISFAVVPAGGVAAQIAPGIYEDNNPVPVATTITGESGNDLATALSALNTKGAAASYGSYTVKLAAQPTLPTHITLGSGSGTGTYPAIGSTDLLIEGLGGGIAMDPVDEFWTLDSGNTLRYGKGVTLIGWTTFVYNTTADNNPAGDTIVNLGKDAGWVGATAAARLLLLSTTGEATGNLTFNSISYQKRYIRSITFKSDVSGVTAIAANFLRNFTGLTELDLTPLSGLTSIGTYFLYSCSSLKELDLTPLAKLASVGSNFLNSCTGLKELDLRMLARITSIPGYFLSGCKGLETLDLSWLVGFTGTTIGSYFLSDCTSLKEIGLNRLSNLTSISDYFLSGCTGLEGLDLSKLTRVTSIGNYFLSGCTGLKELDMGPLANLTTIGNYFMEHCTSIEELDLNGLTRITSIGTYFLYFCTSLKEFDLTPLARFTGIPDGFMVYCTSLEELDLTPLTSLTSIGTNFLYYCSSLKALDLTPLAGFTTTPDIFLGYCGLTSLNLEPLSSLTSIGDYFLIGCPSLTTLNLEPLAGVRTIGTNFLYYSGIYSLDMSPMQSLTRIATNFLSYSNIRTLNLSGLSSVTGIGTEFLYNCLGMRSVNMGTIAPTIIDVDYSFSGTYYSCVIKVTGDTALWTSRFSVSSGLQFVN